MKSTMWKSTVREIKQSLGRFCAILFIVALGVSLFGGLKVTKAQMVKTVQEYWEETGFYDYRLLSTIGYDDQSVEAMRAMEDVSAAEGAVSFDVIGTIQGGNENVIKAHSMTTHVNQLKLTAGRMPQKANECVVDSLMCSEGQIGSRIILSNTNEEADLEHFSYREYTIVGIVKSPLYIQFERGNTALGNGRISGFIYLSPEGFDIDYFTEVYIKFSEEFPLYSAAYDDFLKKKEAGWEQLSLELAAERYQRIKKEAQREIKDAEKELEEGRIEGLKELQEAHRELEKAASEIEDGRKQLEDARKELENARKTLEEKEKELEEGKQSLAKEEQTFYDAQTKLDDSITLWNQQQEALRSGEAELAAGQAQLTAQSAYMTQEEEKLAAAESLLAQQQQQLLQQETLLTAKEVQLLILETAAYTEDLQEQVQKGKKEIAVYRTQIADGKKQLEEAKAQITDGKNALESAKATIGSYQEQLNQGNTELAEGKVLLEEGYRQILEAQKQLAKGRVALEEARVQLVDGEIQIEEGYREIERGEQELKKAQAELEEGEQEYQDGLAQYEEGVLEYETEIADAYQQLTEAKETLHDMEDPECYVLGRDTNVGYVCFENDSGIVHGIANVFPVFFFAVAALVCITTMNRMVEEQRTQIGVLKALGYSKRAIMGKYIFYSGTAAAVGCIGGFLFGTWFFPVVIWQAYGIMYQADRLSYIFDWKLSLISLIVSMLCSVGTTWLSCRYELAEAAAQLMRPKAPKSGKRVFLEKIPVIWRHMSFLHKVSCRNIFRYKKRFFMMIIGISGCTALLVTGFGVKDSISDVASHQYGNILLYDLSVHFQETISEQTRNELEKTLNDPSVGYCVVMEDAMDIVTAEQTKSVYVIAADEKEDISPYIDLHTENGKDIAYPSFGECVISASLANKCNITAGDTIMLRDEDMKTMMLTVTDLHVNYISDYVYITTRTYEELLGQKAPTETAYIRIEEGTDVHKLSASLMKMEDVMSVSVTIDMLQRFNNMMGAMDLIVLVIILCAAGLAFIVLYNLTNINITERIREIATIKVLGFTKKETASYVFRENIALALIGALVGLPLGKYFHAFVMSAIKIDMVSFDVRIKGISYLYSLLLTLIFARLVNRFMEKKLENISMTESLKSVD